MSSPDAQEVAKRSVAVIFQEGVQEAEKILKEFDGNAACLDCAMCFIRTVQCLLTFDHDVMDTAETFLKEVESRCASTSKQRLGPVDTLQLKIIIADCDLLRALLAFARQSLTNYIRGGMLLRSASKAYASVKNEVARLPGDQRSGVEAACSMGLGVVNVAISLVPEKVLNVMKMVGFQGDRKLGLNSLELAARSSDLRAPFAMLLLLGYHVTARPILGIETGDGLSGPIQSGLSILELSKTLIPGSPLFTYFQGRIAFLKRNTTHALECFTNAASACGTQPEVHQLCQYEMAFVKILTLQWNEAADIFLALCRGSPWSPAMYSFFAAIALAAAGNSEESDKMLQDVPRLIKEKSVALDKLLMHKVAVFTKKRLTPHTARVEMLALAYLLNYIRWCGAEVCEEVVEYLQTNEACIAADPYFSSASALVCGAAFVQTEDADQAETQLRRVLVHASTCVEMKESHLPAHATLMLASVYEMRGEFDKARNALEKTKSLYSDYELETQVHTRVKAGLEALPRSG